MTYFAFENTPLSDETGSGKGKKNLSEKQCQDLRDGLMHLPPGHAQVMVLLYLQDVSLEDIAKRLGLDLAEIHTLHYEALARLRHNAK